MKSLDGLHRRTPRGAIRQFMGLVGRPAWTARVRALENQIKRQPTLRHAIRRRYLLEMAFDQLDRRVRNRNETRALPEQSAALAEIAGVIGDAAEILTKAGRATLQERLRAAFGDDGNLAEALHPFAVARRFLELGFTVAFPGLEKDTPHDLLVAKDGIDADVVCVAVGSDPGRAVNSDDWFQLIDLIDPALRAYVVDRPGRYLLKLSMPKGLSNAKAIPGIRDAVLDLLSQNQRSARAESVVMKLDPLSMPANRVDQETLHQRLQAQFGPGASLAIGVDGESAFAVAGRSGKPDNIAAGVLQQMVDVPRRFGGERPGLLFTLVDDVSAVEWTNLRDQMELEVAGRELLNRTENAPVHSVAFLSVADLVSAGPPGFARYRSLCVLNPKHPQADSEALALCAA
jgi:hypothetical protein